jgi:hypothetical protein
MNIMGRHVLQLMGIGAVAIAIPQLASRRFRWVRPDGCNDREGLLYLPPVAHFSTALRGGWCADG